MFVPRLARIVIYPLKSFDGLAVENALVLPSGSLEQDRRFALVDDEGKFINAKRTPRVHELRTEIDPVRRTIALHHGNTEREFHFDTDRAALESWMSEFFDIPCMLVENTDGGFPDDPAAPGPTVVSTATLQTAASWFPGMTLDKARLRFRVNLEIDGVEPFWEDHLYGENGATVRFQVGDVCFEGTNPCQRCAVPTRSPFTGEVTPAFAKHFGERREASLPAWAARSRFDHFYRLAVNTRGLPGSELLNVGDTIHIV